MHVLLLLQEGVGDRLPGDQAECGLGPGAHLTLGTQSLRCQPSP